MFSSLTSFINDFQADPTGSLITFAYLAVVILFSLIIHECAHGYVALKCGDPTAKMLGRLTLDPRKHLDPIGTICMVFLRFGWAKPVPVNPRNFRNYRRDYILVSLAGIVTNLIVFILSLFISAILAHIIWPEDLIDYFTIIGRKELFLDIYWNGPAGTVFSGDFITYGLFTEKTALLYVQRLFLMLAQMNLGLAVFNLLPVPPLDGYRVLDQFVFKGQLNMTPQTMQYIRIGFLVVLLSGMLTGLLGTINSAVFGWMSQLMAMLI